MLCYILIKKYYRMKKFCMSSNIVCFHSIKVHFVRPYQDNISETLIERSHIQGFFSFLELFAKYFSLECSIFLSLSKGHVIVVQSLNIKVTFEWIILTINRLWFWAACYLHILSHSLKWVIKTAWALQAEQWSLALQCFLSLLCCPTLTKGIEFH